MSAPAFTLLTFGCKSNQYESQAMRRALVDAGWREVDVDADVVVLNSCAVTGVAEGASRRKARALARGGARVLLTGCAASIDAPWTDPPPEGVLVLRNRDKADVVATVSALRDGLAAPHAAVRADADDPRFALGIRACVGHARAFLKIQDGCDNHCAYCVVPRARGRPASRPWRAVVDEALRLAEAGHREVGLTGIHIGAYRDEADGGRAPVTLAELVRRIGRELGGRVAIRLGSVEPGALTDDLLAAMAETPGVRAHVHVPLQSGDDAVLARMNRRYTARDFLAAIRRLRAALDRPGIGSDVMVGFPGEDDDAFARTLDVCAAADIARGHVFPFSARPDTPAAAMRPVVQRARVNERRAALTALFDGQAARFAATWIGAPADVVAETPSAAYARRPRPDENTVWYSGYTERYVRIHFTGPRGLHGERVAVRPDRADNGELIGVAHTA